MKLKPKKTRPKKDWELVTDRIIVALRGQADAHNRLRERLDKLAASQVDLDCVSRCISSGLAEFRSSMVIFEKQLITQRPEWNTVISNVGHLRTVLTTMENRAEEVRRSFNQRLEDLRTAYNALPDCTVLHSLVSERKSKQIMPWLSRLYYRWMGLVGESRSSDAERMRQLFGDSP